MADYKQIIPFIKKWEGGLSRITNDSASKNTCPTPFKGQTGWHTNQGITYLSWCSIFGQNNDARFYAMSSEDWNTVFKKGYWDAVKGDQIQKQSIANVLVSWAWGSGPVTAIKQIQKVLGISADGVIGNQTLTAINNADERELFAKCIKQREQFFRQIAVGKNAVFLNGWLNRLRNFEASFKPKA